MKLVKKLNPYVLFVSLAMLFVFFSCKKEDDFTKEPDSTSNTPTLTQADPNKAAKSLSFKNGIVKTGNMPSTAISDILKINRDTITLVDGHEPLIGIKRVDGGVLQTSTTYIQVEGSDSYVEAEFEEVENDTLVYLNMTFDKTDWQLPVTFNLDIVPVDDSGTPISIINIPVKVVEERKRNTSCSIEEFLHGKDSETYYWLVTYDQVGTPVRRLHGQEFSYSQIIHGCCTSSGSYYGDCFGLPTHAMVTGETKTVYGGASLTFHRDGRVTGAVWNVLTQNVDPINFDFCNGIPAYSVTNTENTYQGTYTFNASDCTITIDSLEDNDPDKWFIFSGIGPKTKYLKIADDTLLEENLNPETGADVTLIKVYVSDKIYE